MPVRRILTGLAVAAALVVSFAAPASAHVTISPGEAPADGYAVVELMVPHGCEDAATEELSVQLDPGMQSVRAEAVPGWTAEYTMAELDEPYDLHGTQITEYVAEITWTATGEPLATDQFLTFGINAKWPATPGEAIAIPAVQRCVDGSETAWIETAADAEHPAPVVQVVSSDGDGHGDPTADASDDQAGDDETASAADDSDDSSSTLAIVAIVASVVALGASGFALATARKK